MADAGPLSRRLAGSPATERLFGPQRTSAMNGVLSLRRITLTPREGRT